MESNERKPRLHGLAILACCKAVAIRDANKRWRIVPVQIPFLISRSRLERILAVSVALLVSVVGVIAGWHTAPLWCVPIMAILYAISASQRLMPAGIEHRRLSISNDACPWCGATLATPDQEDRRRCLNCPGEWWDVVGLVAGTSPRQHFRRRLSSNTMSAIIGLLMGLLMVSCLGSSGFGLTGIAYAILLPVSLAIAHAYARAFASPITFATTFSLPLVVAGVAWTAANDLRQGPLAVLLGIGAGAATFVLGKHGTKSRPRDVLHARGRECAACAYDLRSLADGMPCPECGSLDRLR